MILPRIRNIVTTGLTLLALVAVAWGDPVPPAALPKPIPAYVGVRTESGFEQVEGNLIAWDNDSVTIQTRTGPRHLQWNNLSAASAYALRARLIDHTTAGGWLELGTFGWQIGAKDARDALARAVKMDPTLKDQVAAVLKTPSGSAASVPVAAAAGGGPPKYQKSTPEQDAAAIADFRKASVEIQDKLHLKLAEIQTDHFLIFTDWSPLEHGFLKENLEAAYAVVSRQFDIPVKENVFVGKLPVYMLATHEEFTSYAEHVDKLPPSFAGADGYYAGDSRGFGHMLMFKPVAGNRGLEAAKRRWAYTLTHEFTHAFVARYRNNRNIPTWLNEGVAEVVASSQFPDAYAVVIARQTAASGKSIAVIFKNDGPKPAELYPVMRTVAETLIRRDHKAFLALFDSIKQGTAAEAALQATYQWDYAKLEQAWRVYCSTLR